MKALIIAENQDAAAEMGAAARGFADEVVALGIGTDLAGVADKSLKVSVPDDRIVEDAWATVCAIADAEQPPACSSSPQRACLAWLGDWRPIWEPPSSPTSSRSAPTAPRRSTSAARASARWRRSVT